MKSGATPDRSIRGKGPFVSFLGSFVAFVAFRGRTLKTKFAIALLALICSLDVPAQNPVPIGSRRELFVDDFLVERLEGAALKLHQPVLAGLALPFDRPWEGAFSGYVTVLKDGPLFRLYYRGVPTAGRDGSPSEVTCCAESSDGITWRKPNLGLFEVHGTRENNVVLAGQAPFSHNFAPFIDTRPDVPASERFKALAGTSEKGLFGFVSADGLSWRKLRDTPLVTKGAFDSQNVAFWSESEHCYVLYLRTWTGGEFRGFRTVSRATSPDLLHWSEPEEMQFGNTPREHLYTSQTHPYFRAPHIYLALPMRFLPGRQVLTAEQARTLGLHSGYVSDCAETVFMSSRGGTQYTRTFMEGFIRPGLDLGNWASRAGLTALGVVPTGPNELSLYKQAHYAQPSAHLLRYTLRTDGFVSVNAPYSCGELWTRPLTFLGKELALNMSTSAAGNLRVELQDAAGKPLPGFSLADSDEIIGDDIERIVTWKGNPNLAKLAGTPLRLHYVMRDADLYSIQFR
jgi:hypothetical protein